MAESEFIIIWKYTVSRENLKKFENQYGPDGAWQDLFARSKDYLGSVLYRENGTSFLLIDHWRSRESYEYFLEKNRSAYEKMSNLFRPLYDEEERLGTYTSVQ